VLDQHHLALAVVPRQRKITTIRMAKMLHGATSENMLPEYEGLAVV